MTDVASKFTYDCDRAQLGRLAPWFEALAPDSEISHWLDAQGAAPHGLIATRMTQFLSRFASVYDVHGWLGTYPMHLLSAAQWRALLGSTTHERLLDIGAGAGYVTEGARGIFREITCTETSRAMQRRLHKRGFSVHEGALDALAPRSFDVVSCFNVLDRTARPHSLLRAAASCLKPAGQLLLSVPLPVSPHVHVAGGTISPDERLPAHARTWEGAARDLTMQVIEPCGLTVERMARVPYLSRGDADCPLYRLDAAIWLCRLSPETKG